MKKLLALFLTVALTLTSCIALVSCNGNTPGNEDKTPNYAAMEPTELFKTVLTDGIKNGTDAAFTVYEKMFSAFENTVSGNFSGTAATGTIGVEISPLLIGSVLPGVSLNKITAEYDVNFAPDSGLATNLALLCGDIELGKAEIYFDKSTNDAYIALPGLADGTLKMNLEEAFSSAGMPDDMQFEQLSSIELAKYISAVKDYLPKALGLVLDKITAVEKTEETITANGVSAEAIVLTTKINATVARDMIVAVMDDLMTSEDIKNLIKGFYNDNAAIFGFDYYESADELYDEVVSTIAEEKAYLIDSITDDGEEMTVKLYLTSEYALTGLEIKVPDDTLDFSVIYAENGNEIGEEFSFTVDGEKLSSGTLKGTKADGGLFSGTMTIEADGGEMLTVEFENVDYEKAKDGVFSGKYTIIPGSEFAGSMDSLIDPSSMKLVVNLKEVSADKFDIELSLLMTGFDVDNDTTFVKISITNEKTAPESITFPTETVSDPEAWAATLNLEELMSRLKAIGISEDILGGLMY